MKKIFTFFAAAAIAATAMAIPARRGFHTVTNSDGSTLTISLRGDETFHFYVTTDGQPVRQNEKGDWVIDTRDVHALWTEASTRRNAQRYEMSMKRVQKRAKAPLRAGEAADASKTKKGLLILVNFQDVKFSNTDERTQAIYNQMLNSIGNPYGKNYGSVREFFRAQSYGAFDVEFDVMGPVTLSGSMATYGANGANGDDVGAGKMVAEAVNLIKDKVNFADYDWDGDGEVENIYVTYAGYGEANQGADPNTIWPHQYQLRYSDYRKAITINGITIDTYACGSELQGTRGKTIDGIGTFCHEYSHCLGLPDFYDTNQNDGKNFGMDAWSLMDYGCYNNDGFTPAGYTAYERWFSGWLTPIELNAGTTINNMPNIAQNPVAYIVYNDANKNEYYLLENHQLVEWDKAAEGHGMLVVHVDYDKNAWFNNVVNNTASRQRMTIIPADNIYSVTSTSGDPFPGIRKKTELTDESTPAATLYRVNTDGKKFMHKPITDITEANGFISFNFMGGDDATIVETPVVAKETELTSTGLTVNWQKVDDAVSYNLYYSVKEAGSEEDASAAEALNILEDFEKLSIEDYSATSDGTTDVSSKLDEYTYLPGWTGSKVYLELFGGRLGNATSGGMLTTPTIEGTTGKATLYFVISDWFNYTTLSKTGTYKYDGSSVTVKLLDADNNVLSTKTIEPGKISDDGYFFLDPDGQTVTFDNVPSTYKVSFESSKRLYALYFFGFDGEYSLEEVEDAIYGTSEEAPARLIGKKQMMKRQLKRVIRKAKIENTITGILDTHYTIADLTPGSQVSYSIQAVDAEGKTSRWSETYTVTLPSGDDDAVGAVVTATQPQALFDLAGRRLTVGTSQLHRGAYIVGGKKVVILN